RVFPSRSPLDRHAADCWTDIARNRGPTFAECAVLDQLRAILRAPDLLGEVLPQAIELDPTLDEAQVTVAMTRLDAIWDQLFPAEQTRIVRLLVEKVIVSPNDLEVRLRANGIERLVLELRPEPVEQAEEALA
ncbi:hypothetical protein AAG565_15665, partial [Fontimonas sp. SYSU GA230001]